MDTGNKAYSTHPHLSYIKTEHQYTGLDGLTQSYTSYKDISYKQVLRLEGGGACPEQYDAFLKETGEMVAYFRLRHGHFTVSYPDVGGELIYEAEPEGDGCFLEYEFDHYIAQGCEAVLKKLIELGKIVG